MTGLTFLESNLASAFVGGLFTYIALIVTIKHEKSLLKEKEDGEVKAVLLAIKTELQSLKDLYMESVGFRLDELKDNEIFDYTYQADLNYFTVYENNSSVIGKISNKDLRSQIVTTYNLMRGLIETFRVHNSFLDQLATRYNEFHSDSSKLSNVETISRKSLIEIFEGQVKEYSKALFQRHSVLKASIDEVIKSIRNIHPDD